MPLRVIFMGTPEFSVPVLTAILGQGHEVVCAYTQPPRPAGRRGLQLKQSPVHEQAEKLGIEVRTPQSLKSPEEQAKLRDLDADVAVVVAYGLLLPKPVLDAPRLGCFNVHASLLPRWRGAAPIQRAIMAGDTHSGVAIMKMDEGLDTGPVALEESISITPEMTAGDLHDALMPLGADLMIRALAALERGSLALTPQPVEGVTYASKIDKTEARIDWSKPAAEIDRTIRGLSPFPGAWAELDSGNGPERVKLLRSRHGSADGDPGTIVTENGLHVACSKGAVEILHLQKAGSRSMDAETFMRGAALPEDARFT